MFLSQKLPDTSADYIVPCFCKKVNAVDKKKKSEEFKKKKQISEVKVDKLSAAEYQENTSNILRILEQYLDMKR